MRRPRMRFFARSSSVKPRRVRVQWRSMSSHAGPAVAIAIAVAACGGGGPDEPPECIDPADPAISTACAPLYPPTFDNIYTMTIALKCQGSSCHSARGDRGDLTMSTIDGAYTELLQADLMRVVAGDVSCSEVAIRITSTRAGIKMPPGISLSPAEQCSILQWIENGAQR